MRESQLKPSFRAKKVKPLSESNFSVSRRHRKLERWAQAVGQRTLVPDDGPALEDPPAHYSLCCSRDKGQSSSGGKPDFDLLLQRLCHQVVHGDPPEHQCALPTWSLRMRTTMSSVTTTQRWNMSPGETATPSWGSQQTITDVTSAPGGKKEIWFFRTGSRRSQVRRLYTLLSGVCWLRPTSIRTDPLSSSRSLCPHKLVPTPMHQ